jgi:hypothetical protein
VMGMTLVGMVPTLVLARIERRARRSAATMPPGVEVAEPDIRLEPDGAMLETV